MDEQRRKLIRLVLLVLGIGGLLLIPFLFFALVYMGFFGKLHTREELKNIQSYTASQVFSHDEKLLGKFYWENRSSITYKDIPEHLIHALISTEDSRFYEHNGVDARGLLRVFFKTLLLGDKSAGGGSTIAQQLAKNLFKRKNYGMLTLPVNKMKEAIYAVRLSKIYNEQEILTMYLNTVSVGEDTYGIYNASMRFFSKPPKELSIQQAAVLVAMLKSPTYYNPRLRPMNALTRRNIVIKNMAENKYITKKQADSLIVLPLNLKYKNVGMYGELAPYYMVQIEQQAKIILDSLSKASGKKYNLYTDGFTINTSLNYQMQVYATNAMAKHMQKLQKLFDAQVKRSNPFKRNSNIVAAAVKRTKRYVNLKEASVPDAEIRKIFATPVPIDLFSWEGNKKVNMSPLDSIKYYLKILRSGFLAMNPKTGEILAWVGGIDYTHFQYDHVTSTRQVGSTFKPIVYATAIDQGVSPCEYFKNELHVYEQFNNWSPQNSDGKYGGKYSVKGALANSINVVSVEVLLRAGVDNVIRTARDMGIQSDIPRVPSIALGVADISLLEMVKAYCSFANGGTAVNPVYISNIKDIKGNIIYQANLNYKGKRAMSAQAAYYTTEMLRAVVNEGTAARLRGTYGVLADVAGKTGTTQSHADGWFIGYTPHLVAGSWVGAENPALHFNSIEQGQGASMALPIWAYFIKDCKNDKRYAKYVDGSFNYGNNLIPMPACASFQPDDAMDNLMDWLNMTRDERQERREQRQEERRERRERRKEERKKFFDNLFGRKRNN